MSNYQKYYSINMKKMNPNKCLLRLPLNTNGNSRYGWGVPLDEILFKYFGEAWFTGRGTKENILYKYVKSVLDHEKFDFNGYKCVGDELYPNLFKEIKKTHEACTNNIYTERIYTNFHSFVLSYHGLRVSILATLLHHREFLKSLNYPDSAAVTYYRRYNLDEQQTKGFKKFIEYLLASETVTPEEDAIILDGYRNFVDHVKKQKIYSPDEMPGYRDKSFINNIFSLYLEYFIFTQNESYIYDLFKVFHEVGNEKAKTFNRYLKNKGKDEADTYSERPISNYIFFHSTNTANIPLEELYYFIKFYKTYKDGKFLNKVINDNILQSYIMSFKTIAATKLPLKKDYYTLFNQVKGDEVYTLETFEQMNMLVASNLSGSKALDILEQNFAMLELCLVSDVYAGRWSSDVYNIFTKIEYNDLTEAQQNRYWKMIANFVNTTKLKSAKIKKILTDISRLLCITAGDIITKLQPHIISIKQPILLEMYLE